MEIWKNSEKLKRVFKAANYIFKALFEYSVGGAAFFFREYIEKIAAP